MMAETVPKKGAGNPLFGHGDPCRWSSVLGRAALDNNSILRQLLLVGVGTTTLLAEQLKKAADELVQKGQLSSEEASNLLNNLLNQVKSEQSNLESYVQRQVRNVLQDLACLASRKWTSCAGGWIAWSDSAQLGEPALRASDVANL
jgi:Uncharacterized conserved protein, COG3937